ncbi:MAG: hypothetical protein R6U20_12290 [Longimonas sp.]|uniref:hypothetical protein n=1 Tax=Longimonas sp. TaxID=2039626 RepID=UPI0039768326
MSRVHVLFVALRSLPGHAAFVVSGLLIIGMGLGGCSTGSAPIEETPGLVRADSSTLVIAYERAIWHAAQLGADSVVQTLTPVAPHNDTLRWQVDGDSTRWVQVTTWTDDAPLPGARTPSSDGDTLTLAGDVWVTLTPAVQQFCRDLPPEHHERRLEQRLGLPPYAGYTQFVTFWASTEDLFRPCPDPEITDRQCTATAPQPASRVRVAPEHTEWLDEQFAFSHQPGGYPFTGLGYTYDWGRPGQPVGFSEFVVPEGATIRVEDQASTAAYCTPEAATNP